MPPSLQTSPAKKKVPTHPAPHRQSRHNRPRPLPRPQPSPRPRLLRPPTDRRPALLEKYVHRAEKRLQGFPSPAQKRRAVNALGGPRRADAQYLLDGRGGQSQQPCESRVGEVHAEGYRHGGENAYARGGVPRVGEAGGAEGGEGGSEGALCFAERASESVECCQGICRFFCISSPFALLSLHPSPFFLSLLQKNPSN